MNADFKSYTYRCDEGLKADFDVALRKMRRKTASEEIRMAIARFVQAVNEGNHDAQLEIPLEGKDE